MTVFYKKDPLHLKMLVDDKHSLLAYWHLKQDCIMNADTSAECNIVIIGYLERGILYYII